MSINSPYVKKQENLDFLQKNEELFIEYMSKEQSVYSLAHTMLHSDSFDDKYVESLKKKMELHCRMVKLQEDAIKKSIKSKTAAIKEKPIKEAKKIDQIEKIVSDAVKQKEQEIDESLAFPE